MTSENVTEAETVEPSERQPAKAVDDRLIDELVSRAQAEGLRLTGEGGLLQQLAKRLLESALEGEITDHLGYDKHDPAGKNGGNSRDGTRAKTVLTDVGPVEVSVPRDRDGSFEPKIVKKRQKRLSGVDEMVISLAAKGLTTGEVQAHLAEVYGAEVSLPDAGPVRTSGPEKAPLPRVLAGQRGFREVEPRGVEPLTSAMQKR
ncbi:Transposase, Mutator family [Streptomyces sp. di188]|nr:Transposase, Mutator family [Streptomyces sp. di50b]SCD75931.1 Transposase, Mutator family [Streptomyces sp. di188]